jgi:hypothetical protein
MVGTTNRSMAAMSGAWFRRNVRQNAAAATSLVLCGRCTAKMTWPEIVALYRLTLTQPRMRRSERTGQPRRPHSK